MYSCYHKFAKIWTVTIGSPWISRHKIRSVCLWNLCLQHITRIAAKRALAVPKWNGNTSIVCQNNVFSDRIHGTANFLRLNFPAFWDFKLECRAVTLIYFSIPCNIDISLLPSFRPFHILLPVCTWLPVFWPDWIKGPVKKICFLHFFINDRDINHCFSFDSRADGKLQWARISTQVVLHGYLCLASCFSNCSAGKIQASAVI